MTIHLILPDPSTATLDESFSGAREMKRFWRSGDFLDFPENPHVFVMVDWLLRAGQEGFAKELAMLGTDHQAVIDQVLHPAENGRLYHLAKTHPLKLLHCLWRIGMAYCSYGDEDEPRPMPTSSLHLWLMLFACQRGYLRDRWSATNEDGSPSWLAVAIRNLYQAFRRAVAEEQRNPGPQTPVYLPVTPEILPHP